ncbi:ribonuclease HII [Amycolatopsis antarctica]|uniref:ribonuclease HII n=1 Tax=Amycolatopsis antarctica TaxID=1854586 RepID=UPI001F0AC3EC|nr:ribonuclease HII [Amycolatopsis antarctica]
MRGDNPWALQSALDRKGLGPVAGVDEAGRGACAGPLVIAACVLRPGDAARHPELTDSKLLTAAARDRVYDRVLARAVDHTVIIVPPAEVDALGIHVTNVEGMRRAVAGLTTRPGYVLTDGFRVPGLPAPSVPVIKGDRVAACVAAASVLAKVTRDRIMEGLHVEHPVYGFDVHKGYSTTEHGAALTAHGPSAVHRWSYANVALAGIAHGRRPPWRVMLTAAALSGRTVPEGALEDGVGQNERFAGGRQSTTRGGARIT